MKKFQSLRIVLGLALLSASTIALAQSGADYLLQSVGGSAQSDTKSGQSQGQILTITDFKLTDPFLLQLFAQWQGEKNLPYDVSAWAIRVLKGDYQGSAHLWSAIRKQLPASFENTGNLTQAYLLWKLGVSQSFFDHWITLLSQPAVASSRLEQALEQTLASGFDQWLIDHAIQVTPEQEFTISKMDLAQGPVQANLRGWISLRKGLAAQAVMDALPAGNALKPYLGETVALAMAKTRDLSGAAKVLKTQVEPGIELKKDPHWLARHYMEIGRLLYQAGSMDGAEHFYEKVPSGTLDYLTAREELMWVRLRKNDQVKLRGELATLSSKLFEDQFAPEVFLVRAISNLKLCFYNEVEKDFGNFLALNSKWAKQITAALESQDPPAPSQRDFFTLASERALEQRSEEVKTLEKMAQESISAVLPAVGPQQHWTDAKTKVLAKLELAKKARSQEYRKQWKNQKSQLAEAIRKMQFVKVELLSQVRLYGQNTNTDEIRVSSAAVIRAENQDMSFPFDGVIWPDELFRLRSVAQGRCLAAAGPVGGIGK